MRNNSVVQYSISSSIWTGIKPHLNSVLENSSWLLGDGSNINFWNDVWLSKPLNSLLSLPAHLHSSLNAKVKDFPHNNSWFIPSIILQNCPAIAEELKHISIPSFPSKDTRVWCRNESGSLTLKDAF